MKKILVVDDQQDIRDLVRMTLEMGGHEVHEAGDGEEALRLLPALQPDLMLLDVMMPGAIDGLGVCRRLKAGAPQRGPKVVMLSARSQPGDHEAGLAAGADAYLGKPFSPRELLQVVSRML